MVLLDMLAMRLCMVHSSVILLKVLATAISPLMHLDT